MCLYDQPFQHNTFSIGKVGTEYKERISIEKQRLSLAKKDRRLEQK